MIYGLLLTLYLIVCLFLILLVLIQKGKSSMGIGNLGGGVQMLFGGSGGQDLFQKTTWALGAIFMAGSLFLSILKTHQYNQSRYITERPAITMPKEAPVKPEAPAPTPQ